MNMSTNPPTTEERKRRLLQRVQDFKKNKNYLDNIGECFVVPVSNNEYVTKMDYYYWHSINGRILGENTMKMNGQILQMVGFVVALQGNSYIQYVISLTDYKSYAYGVAFVLVFLLWLMLNISVGMINSYILRKMKVDNVEYETDLDLQLKQAQEEDKQLSMSLNNHSLRTAAKPVV
jgi:hypothetical protein